MPTQEQLDFMRRNRLCVVGIARASGPPHLTPVYYALDGEEIVISTTASRFKAKALRRNPEVSLCILGEAPPFPYLLIYGRAAIEDEGAVEVMMKIGERMTGSPLPASARPAVEERARKEGRVVIRVRPERFSSTLPLARREG